MSNSDCKLDRPVPLRTDDLPIPVVEPAHHQIVTPYHLQWRNLASQCHIRSLAVDPTRGDLWLATGGGILRWWAGMNRFTRYASEHGLPGNFVKLVAVDGKGQSWAAHEDAGLSYLKDDIWQPYPHLSKASVSCFSIDRVGQLWVGTGTGLYGVHDPNREPTLIELPPHSAPPRSLTLTTTNDIWLCTARGVFHRQDTWECYNQLPSILALARQGNNLWLGTLAGLVWIDLMTNQSHLVGESRAEVSALAPTKYGVWAVCGKQVGFATETSWTPVRGKAYDFVTSLAPAGEESIWIGRHPGLQFANSATSRFQLTESPPDVIGVIGEMRPRNIPLVTFSNLVQALGVQYTQSTTMLWVGTARGLFRIDLSTESWRRLGQLSERDIRAVIIDETDQNLWVASWSGDLYTQEASNLVAVPGISEPITTLASGLEAGCWVGSLAGVYWCNGNALTPVVPATKLPGSAWIRAIAQSQADCLWIGTSAGLFTYNPKTGVVSPVSSNSGNSHIQSLLILSTEKIFLLWVGTQRGLYYVQPEKLEPLKLEPFTGLERRAITTLTADLDNQRVWVGTDRGLFCLSNKEGTWAVSDRFDPVNSGLAHHRVTALAIDTSQTGKTRLWIGTPCGLSAYTYKPG